jgi:predicted ATP-grasp superfamily ATP-dependent carboligase
MSGESPLIVISASARAAVWSARQSGFAGFAVDQFGDTDLREVASQVCVVEDWPRSVLDAVATLPDGPFVFGGGLENSPELIEELATSRELLGCSAKSLRLVRDPFWLADCWRSAGLKTPRLLAGDAESDCDCVWLRKPRYSAGGLGVRFDDGRAMGDDVLQEFVRGDVVSGLFLGNGRDVRLLGMASQLVGCSEAGAEGFVYCGSIWPGEFDERAVGAGETLVQAAGLVGLFGIDFVRDEHGELWPIEVNPRYPASAEQCERSTGWPLMRWHVAACRSGWLPAASELAASPGGSGRTEGKIVVYSPRDLPAPDVRQLADRLLPTTAQVVDIPVVGSPLKQGAPVCSLLSTVGGEAECREGLLKLAASLRSALTTE